MRKKFSPIIAMLLIATFITTAFSPSISYAINSPKINIVEQIKNDEGETILETAYINNVRYDFVKTSDYNKSTVTKPNSHKITVIKYANDDDYVYIEDSTKTSVEKVKISSFMKTKNSPQRIRASFPSTSDIDDDIEDEFGEPYENKYLKYKVVDNHGVLVQEDYNYSHYVDANYSFLAKAGIHFIAAVTGLGAGTLVQLLSGLLSIKDGVQIITGDVDIKVHNLELYFDRFCEIGDDVYYRASKTEKYLIATHDRGGIGFDYVKTIKDSDFDNLDTLIEKAVENYDMVN